MAKSNCKTCSETETSDGKKGGLLEGDSHAAASGGISAVVSDSGNRPVKLEGGEVIINKKSVKKFWRELSRINQAGGGVPISRPVGAAAKDGGAVDALTVQVVVFDKKKFSEADAKAWLKKNNYSQAVEKGFSVFMAVQEQKKKFQKKSMVTKKAEPGISIVSGKLK